MLTTPNYKIIYISYAPRVEIESKLI